MIALYVDVPLFSDVSLNASPENSFCGSAKIKMLRCFLFCCLCPQIKHMMAFIEQEANEKAEEIDAKVQTHVRSSIIADK